MSARRWIVIAGVLAAVALAVAYGFFPRAVLVDTGAARTAAFRVVVAEEARTRVVDRFVISAPVAGYLRRIVLDPGDDAAKGQRVATLEPLRAEVLDPRRLAEARARVRSAEDALQSAREKARAARAADEYADTRLSRTRRLHESGVATREALDQAETEALRASAERRSADFSVEVASHELEAARTTLRYAAAGEEGRGRQVVLVSPVSGSVLAVRRKDEGVVGAGEPLLEIGDPNRLEVVSEVLSEEAVRIRPGMRVLFERWGGKAPLEGKVRIVEPSGYTKVSALGVEEQRVNVISDILSREEDRLGDGYRLDARFVLWEGDRVLQVPSSALFRHGEGWAVFRVEAGKASVRPVEAGRRGGMDTEILSGLSEGDRVVLYPDDRIGEGVRVRVR